MEEHRIGNGGCSSFGGVLVNSRYANAVRCLLEEVIDIGGREVDLSNELLIVQLFPGRRSAGIGISSEIKAELCSYGLTSSPETRELQIRIGNLVGLLEQVEVRFEKYCNQLESVITSFEEIAGAGSAKPYTGLALQAMARHFGTLQDAIIGQINSARRKFPHHCPTMTSPFSSFQRPALMQGQQRHAWRPIRGLPETSVSILRDWLFQHFLHPYPNTSEKLMLASQTGLSKNQVSNWFINARVRLWKPMIEEMYREEFSDSSDDSNQPRSVGSMQRESIADHLEY